MAESMLDAIGSFFGRSAEAAVWSNEPTPTLYAEEEAAVDRAVPKRKLEFARGRAAARAALSALGVRSQAIPAGPQRAPVWPEGYVGSITHCDGLIAAVAADEAHLAAIGLDAEPARPLPPETRARVLHPAEMSEDPVMETVVFSAKESIHKAIFPLTGVWLDFLDVEVSLDQERGCFSVGPAGAVGPVGRASADDTFPPELLLLEGRYARTNEFVVTGCFIPGSAYESPM